MKTLNSFFLRWLISTDETEQKIVSVIDVEHIQSEKSCRVASLEEASLWMEDVNSKREAKQKKTEKEINERKK